MLQLFGVKGVNMITKNFASFYDSVFIAEIAF